MTFDRGPLVGLMVNILVGRLEVDRDGNLDGSDINGVPVIGEFEFVTDGAMVRYTVGVNAIISGVEEGFRDVGFLDGTFVGILKGS